MSRDLSPDNLAAVTADVVEPVLFAELDFGSGTVRVHSALGTIPWGGNDWQGVGNLGKVSPVEDTSELSRRTISYTRSGIPSALVATVMGENYLNRTARLYVGFRDTATGLLVDTPELLDQGRMDASNIKAGKEAVITINAESRFAKWDKPVVRRYNDADQKARFPGDRGCEFVEQAAEREITWGKKLAT